MSMFAWGKTVTPVMVVVIMVMVVVVVVVVVVEDVVGTLHSLYTMIKFCRVRELPPSHDSRRR